MSCKRLRLAREIDLAMNRLDYTQVRKISAVPKSSYSNLAGDRLWRISLDKQLRKDPTRLISILLILAHEKPFFYELFLEEVSNLCYRHRYQGKWRFLHKLSELQDYNLIVYRLSEVTKGNVFFGTTLRNIEKELSKDQFPVRYLEQILPKPNHPKRKRGYDDKGSRRLPHEVHSDWRHTGPNPYRPDYRNSYKKKKRLMNFLLG